eukprot:105496_1
MAITLPNIWPIFNLINLVNFDEKKRKRNITYSSLGQVIVKWLAVSTYLFVSFIAYKYTFPSYKSILSLQTLSKTDYYTFFIKWLTIIVIRDELIVIFFYSWWHYILYESSTISKKIMSIKYNPSYPDQKQWQHDRYHTLKGTFISSIYEVFVIYYFSNRLSLLQNDEDFFKYLHYNIFWIVFITYFRPFHFYFIHRFLHQWGWKLPIINIDFGKVLYKYVHSLHHKSYNTGPWSGMSMHIIEHLIYYTSFLYPICFGIFIQHPILVLYNKWHCNLSPLPSHDGFANPGGGDYFHFLHHAHFECNYGSASIPMDYWFGTLEDGEKYKKKKQYDSKNKYKST